MSTIHKGQCEECRQPLRIKPRAPDLSRQCSDDQAVTTGQTSTITNMAVCCYFFSLYAATSCHSTSTTETVPLPVSQPSNPWLYPTSGGGRGDCDPAASSLCSYGGEIGAYLVVGGVDNMGAHLFTIHAHGSVDKLPYVSMGRFPLSLPSLSPLSLPLSSPSLSPPFLLPLSSLPPFLLSPSLPLPPSLSLPLSPSLSLLLTSSSFPTSRIWLTGCYGNIRVSLHTKYGGMYVIWCSYY